MNTLQALGIGDWLLLTVAAIQLMRFIVALVVRPHANAVWHGMAAVVLAVAFLALAVS